jgi:hypothetical protein
MRAYTGYTGTVKVGVKEIFTLEQTFKAQKGKWRYSSTLSLTSALDRVGDLNHARLLFCWEGEEVTIGQEAVWVPGRLGTRAENFVPTGIRSLDFPVCSKSTPYRYRTRLN